MDKMTTRVLITGITGFVGSWMIKTVPQGVEYVGVGRDGYESGILESLCGITHIVHLAPVHPEKVVALARKHNARLLYCSSGIVYYPDNDIEYRRDKLEGEKYCLDSGLDVVIARPFAFFGDGLDKNKAISQFFDAVRAGKPITMHGNGSTIRTYMHGAEMGRQMWKILLDGESGRAYDVGSTHKTTIGRLAKRISSFTGAKIESIDAKIPMPEYYPSKMVDIRCPACVPLGWPAPRLLLQIRDADIKTAVRVKCHRCKSVVEYISGTTARIITEGERNPRRKGGAFE